MSQDHRPGHDGDTKVPGRTDDQSKKEPDQEVEDLRNRLLQPPPNAARQIEELRKTLHQLNKREQNLKRKKAKKTGRSAERVEQRLEGVRQQIESKHQES